MISSEYIYLISMAFGLLPLLIFFYLHNDVRQEFLISGLVVAFCSLITSWLFWTHDWWFPETLFGTRAGFEDLILGFNAGASALVIDNLFFGHVRETSHDKNWPIIIASPLIFIGTMCLSFYWLEINSFHSFLISSFVVILWIYLSTKISPLHGVYFAVIYAIISLWFYFFIFIIDEAWIFNTWDLSILSGIVLFNFIPIEEFVFWLLFGLMFKQVYLGWNRRDITKSTCTDPISH